VKTLIVDDEPIARKVLREELELQDGVEVVGEAENGLAALQIIAEAKPDLVFLDLEMPAMGGFEVIRSLTGAHLPVFVIVTAFNQHAIQAFEAGAVDYLLKPVNEKRLAMALERARSLRSRPKENAEQISQISSLASDDASATPRSRRIVGRLGQEYFLLDADEVLAFQAEGEIVWIVTAGHKYMATQSLRLIESRVQHLSFQRVHRNAIVNVNHVRKMSAMSSQRWLLTLSNAMELVVSKRQAQSMKHILHW